MVVDTNWCIDKMGKMYIKGEYKHQSGEANVFKNISRAEFDTLLRRLDLIGGNYNVEATFEYHE